MIYHTKKQAPKVPVRIQLPTSGETSNESATLNEIVKETTITITASIAYHIQFGNDSFGMCMLS